LHWDDIVQLAVSTQIQCAFYRLLGLDIALSSTGPIVIEINAFPDLVAEEQLSGPLLKDSCIKDEFNKYDLLINKFQKKLFLLGAQ
jgi:glutathione synthase/RimK-type ligase-like ATP-grasp enzyme